MERINQNRLRWTYDYCGLRSTTTNGHRCVRPTLYLLHHSRQTPGKKTVEVKIPTRHDWSNQKQNLQRWPEIYTDGSKFDGRVGAGIHSTCLAINKAIPLPDHCSVFQAEICAIYEAINWLETNRQSVWQPYGHWTRLTFRRDQS